jgi:sugar fermentation stimulation protein A
VLIPHRWPGPPIAAVLIDRPNRFLARCRLEGGAAPADCAEGSLVRAHVPDRGRCLDLLVPGQPLVLVAAAGAERRTQHTCLLARARSAPDTWVSLDPAGAPRLVAEAICRGLLFRGSSVLRREVTVRHGRATSRIDLLLGAADPDRDTAVVHAGDILCEVKSVGAARDGLALFPDAPTERGARHLALLAARARKGHRSAVVFVAQRGDVRAIAADREIDPGFARALRRARAAGVIVAGLACSAEPLGMRLLGELPVLV